MLSTKSKIAKCSTVTLILPRRSRCKLKLEKLAAMHSLTWGFLGSIIYGIIIIVSDRMGFGPERRTCIPIRSLLSPLHRLNMAVVCLSHDLLSWIRRPGRSTSGPSDQSQ
jgi:hypothetical protein